MNVLIRPAKKEEIKDLMRLNSYLFDLCKNEFDSTIDPNWEFSALEEKMFDDNINKENACVFVAEVDGKLVGYVSGSLREVESYREKMVMSELENIMVLEEFQGHNIGMQLYDTFINWSNQRNVTRVRICAYAKNIKAISFYHKLGYENYDINLEKDI